MLQIPINGTVHSREIAVIPIMTDPIDEGYFSTGAAWSSVFARPSYQNSTLEHYLATNAPDPTRFLYHPKNRAYPDLAMNGYNTVVYSDGEPIADTRSSTPTAIIASMVNRINDKRLTAGKCTLGFLNPLLYKNPHAFNDVSYVI